MNNPFTGTGFLDGLATSVAALLNRLLVATFGPGLQAPVLGGLSVADLALLLCGALLLLLLNGLLTGFIRGRTRTAATAAEGRAWRALAWGAAERPARFLLWVYGTYLVASPLLLRMPLAHPARTLTERVLDVSGFAALLWLCFRAVPLLESRCRPSVGGALTTWESVLVALLGRCLRVLAPALGVLFALPLVGLPPETAGLVNKGSTILLIGVVAYLLFQAVTLGQEALLARHDISVADNLRARKVHTQVHVLARTLYVAIGIFAAASVLMLFDEVRRFGASILASAGVVGIIVGFAVQRTIANLFAGFQLAMTQPIRLDDVVIVEGEWGRVEEITLTYVVIRIWDDRRLVVPLSHFIEKPFQNWTRASAEILGSVLVWADYTLPIAELRPAVGRIVADCPDWDGRFWNLQVTESNEHAIQLRVLATAADASKAWNLRCEIRERLISLLQERYPQSLPRLRAEFGSARPCSPAPPPHAAGN